MAICPDDATNLAELISNADAAMYQAKTSGKNRSARFSRALHDKRTRLRQIQDELRSLDPDEQFHLVYMPMVDTNGRVTGCEARITMRTCMWSCRSWPTPGASSTTSMPCLRSSSPGPTPESCSSCGEL